MPLNLYVEELGTGPAVVLLHGTCAGPTLLMPLAVELARDHRVFVPHFPGYGQTPLQRHSVAELLTVLRQALHERKVRSAALVGASRGSYLSLALALRGEIRVTALALVAAVAGLDPSAAEQYRQLARAIRADKSSFREGWLALMATAELATRNPDAAAALLQCFEDTPAEVMAEELEAFSRAEDLRPRLTNLTCKTLIAVGARDAAMPAEWSDEIARKLPNATLHVLDGVGHCPLVENAGLIKLIARHVRSVVAAS